MFKNYIKIAWRNLQRQPGFTMLNILGLAIGIAGFLFLVLYIRDELSYDKFNTKADRIYRVALERKYPDRSRQYAIIPAGYAEAMATEYPGVEETCRLFFFGPANMLLRKEDNTYREDNIIWSDSTFFEFFDIPLLAGNAASALSAPNSIVLTEDMALKYFGSNWASSNIIGSPLDQVQGDDDFTITGVCANVPSNSHLSFEFLVSSTSMGFLAGDPDYVSFSAMTYLLLDEKTQADQLETKFPDLVAKYVSGPVLNHFGVDYATYQEQGNGYNYTLQNLGDIYLDSIQEGEIKPPGSRSRIYFFSLIALLIIVIAGINFINLSTARSAGRAREVGIRKTLGSEKSQLVIQFLVEALLISGIAALIAGIIVGLALPWFNALTEKTPSRGILLAPFSLSLLAGVAMLTGLASGFYPAVFLSSFKPIEVLQGRLLQNTKGGGLRNALVVCQFAISIFLIVATILIYQQLQYTQNKSLGFNKESLVTLQNAGGMTSQQSETFLEQIGKLPGVVAASSCNSVPGQFYFGVSFQPPGADEMTTGSGLIVGENYVECMKMDLVAGREFSKEFADTLSVLVNEAAVREMGLKDPIGQRLSTSDGWLNPDPENPSVYKIVGVLKDYHFQSLHHGISPLFFVHKDRNANGAAQPQISVRLAEGNPQAALGQIEGIWNQFQPDVPLSYLFVDREWAKLYTQETTARRVFVLFTTLAIIIACLGLFGLAAYLVEKRRKEISIRKVLGASTAGLVQLLSQDFLKLVVIALLVASPLAYYFMDQWLQNFAYRITISWWVFLLAGGLALGIAFVTVGLQSVKAALANPVKALKNE
jgi:putative ABC transport system permease protein